MGIKHNLVEAAAVYFGSYEPYEDCTELIAKPYFENPEKMVIFKDSILKLSGEAKLVLAAVMRLPEEMFQHGRIVNSKLIRFMKKRYKMSAKQTQYALLEIKAVYE